VLPSRLVDELDQHMYMPTSVAVPVLNFTSASGEVVEMVLVGDPAAPVVQINDGRAARPGTWTSEH
jgi:hypothetical protein